MEQNILYVVIILCALILPGTGFYGGVLWIRRQAQKEKDEALAARQDTIRRYDEKMKEMQDALYKAHQETDDLSNYFFKLPDFVRSLSFNPNEEEIASSVVRYLKNSLDPQEIGFFVLRDKDTLWLIESFGLSPQYKKQLKVSLGEGKIGRAVANGVVMGADDYRHEPALHRVGDDHVPLRTDLCAPIRFDEKTLGAINLAMPPGGYKEKVKQISAMVADLAAAPLDHYYQMEIQKRGNRTDGLTGLYNKSYFLERLAGELNKSYGDSTALSLFIFDIDHFKHYNDTNGHPAGDLVLKEVARIAKSIPRETDMVARYGGEEFVVLLIGCSKAKALERAESIREAIEKNPFPNGEKQPQGRLTISGGVASYPDDAQTAQELIKFADEALYQAKAGGRNAICMYRGFVFDEGEGTQVIKG